MCVGQRHRGTKRRYSVECRGNPPPVSPGFLLNDVEFRLFPALATSHVTRHASHVTRHTSRVTRHASHVTRHTSHVTRHTSHVTRHTSRVTRRRGLTQGGAVWVHRSSGLLSAHVGQGASDVLALDLAHAGKFTAVSSLQCSVNNLQRRWPGSAAVYCY